MKLIIDNRSGQPIYDQIYNQLRDQIINGTLAEDESLPSIAHLPKICVLVLLPQNDHMKNWREKVIFIRFQEKEVLWQEKNVQLIQEQKSTHQLKNI